MLEQVMADSGFPVPLVEAETAGSFSFTAVPERDHDTIRPVPRCIPDVQRFPYGEL